MYARRVMGVRLRLGWVGLRCTGDSDGMLGLGNRGNRDGVGGGYVEPEVATRRHGAGSVRLRSDAKIGA